MKCGLNLTVLLLDMMVKAQYLDPYSFQFILMIYRIIEL